MAPNSSFQSHHSYCLRPRCNRARKESRRHWTRWIRKRRARSRGWMSRRLCARRGGGGWRDVGRPLEISQVERLKTSKGGSRVRTKSTYENLVGRIHTSVDDAAYTSVLYHYGYVAPSVIRNRSVTRRSHGYTFTYEKYTSTRGSVHGSTPCVVDVGEGLKKRGSLVLLTETPWSTVLQYPSNTSQISAQPTRAG